MLLQTFPSSAFPLFYPFPQQVSPSSSILPPTYCLPQSYIPPQHTLLFPTSPFPGPVFLPSFSLFPSPSSSLPITLSLLPQSFLPSPPPPLSSTFFLATYPSLVPLRTKKEGKLLSQSELTPTHGE
uniref:Uncharacterized protein n=1 Tax=Cacopsylla melanoneura TaxID=428564 RepID=A0A8D8Z9B7_9HEMI